VAETALDSPSIHNRRSWFEPVLLAFWFVVYGVLASWAAITAIVARRQELRNVVSSLFRL
jgi:hypothetical protein